MDTMNQPGAGMGAPMSTQGGMKKKSNAGLIIAIIVIIIIIIALVAMNKAKTNTSLYGTSNEATPATNTSDELNDIDADLNATNVDNLDSGLQ